MIYTKGADQEVVKIDGLVTTTMKDGQPEHDLQGHLCHRQRSRRRSLASRAQGTYSGYFTAEDKYHVAWEGTRTTPKNAIADTKK